MNHEQLQKEIERMTEELYDQPREDSISAMVSEFYSRKMLTTAILVWVNFLLFFGLAAACAVMFFLAGDVSQQIMYAALFVCFMQWSTLGKVYAWQAIHKIQIKREIKRLELRVVELAQAVVAK